jgi:hypothetical protein
MYARADTPSTDRIDPDAYEPSPSLGPEETVTVLGGRPGYDHEPPAGDADPDPVTIDAAPPVDADGRTDTDAARPDREVSA